MKIELEFFEYPKHKPKVNIFGYVNLVCKLNLNVFRTMQGLMYAPKDKDILMNEQGVDIEPYVTHWAYLPKKPIIK